MSDLTHHLDQIDTDVRYFAAWADEALVENMHAVTAALRDIDARHRLGRVGAEGPWCAGCEEVWPCPDRRILDRITGGGDAPTA